MTAAIERPEAEHHDPSIRTGKDTRGACYRRECTCGYVGMKMSGTPREGADDRPCPEDRTAVALTTLQFANGGLFDPRPVPGDVTPYAVHLVRVGANGGTPGPALCGIERFGPDAPGWCVGGGVTGPKIRHIPCPGCLEAACTKFGCLPIGLRGIGAKEMTARAKCARDAVTRGRRAAEFAGLDAAPIAAEILATRVLGGDLALAKAIVAQAAEDAEPSP